MDRRARDHGPPWHAPHRAGRGRDARRNDGEGTARLRLQFSSLQVFGGSVNLDPPALDDVGQNGAFYGDGY